MSVAGPRRGREEALFDAYAVVDWSAAARRASGANSVWIASVRREGSRAGVPKLANPGTRASAVTQLQALLREAVRDGVRVLVGYDFALGYPGGTAAALELPGRAPPWEAVWQELAELIDDAEDNRNNRFEVAGWLNARMGAGPGPFWGCPRSQERATLTATRRNRLEFPYETGLVTLGELRLVEERLRSQQHRIQSVWKLGGAGAVGSQTLLGIPAVRALRHDPAVAGVSAVWPFETGLSSSRVGRPTIVHAEVWPSLHDLDLGAHPVRDAAQVLGLARRLALLDGGGALAMAFEPEGLDATRRGLVEREEGWILGA